jgi:hypothetical protein
MKNKKIALLALLMVVVIVSPSASAIVGQIIGPMTNAICRIYGLIKNVAGAIAALIITIAGFKWVGSAEDPGARKQAKDNIVHAIVGMLIVSIATDIVTLITERTVCLVI